MNTPKIIAIANHKGGVGKTTTTASVGSILAGRGYRVLAVDLDAQANLTVSLLREEPEQSIYHALTGRTDTLPILTVKENFDLVPASLQLAMCEMELVSAISREFLLAGLLRPVYDSYDIILIDCPPSLGLLTLNAFAVATDIIIPLVAESLPFKGLKMIMQFFGPVRSKLNPGVHLQGILLTRWESTRLARNIEERLRDELGERVFITKIRKNISLAAAPMSAVNIVDYAPNSHGAQDYITFTEELLTRIK